MRRHWSPVMIVAVLAVLFLFVGLPFSSRTQEEDLRYTYRMGCPDRPSSSYCPARYESLSTDKDEYAIGETINLTLSDLKDFEYLVEKVEIHFKPIFEHDYELFYTQQRVGPISRDRDEWSWTWDQVNSEGETLGAGRGYIRLTLNCCKNYRTYFGISKSISPAEPEPPEEEEPAEPTTPERPGNLTSRALSETEIEISWDDNSANEEGFRVYRNGELIATLGPNVTDYTDTGLEGGQTYTYTVRAYNAAGESAATSSTTLQTPAAPKIPSAPGGLSSRILSAREIELTWSDNSEDEEGFRVYRNGTVIAELDPNTTRYVDSDLTGGESYTYRVSSFNQDGESPLSSELNITTPMEIPNAPGQLRVEVISSSEVGLSWQDNSDNEEGFRIYRNGNQITTIGPNLTEYTDTDLQEDTSYTYRVAAFNESGESSSEPLSSMTPLGKPEGPGELTSEALSPEQIRLSWQDNSDNEDGFRVYRNGELVAELNPNTTVYTDTDLSGGTGYNYRVSSFNQSGETFAPYELEGETQVAIPVPPVQPVARPISPNEIEISWQDNSENEDGFRVYRNGERKATIEANVTSYLDTGLDGGTNYTYRVSAYNDGGESPRTSGISATTPVEIPTPPRNLASESLSPTEIRLSWRDTSENEAGFRVYRNGNQIADLGPDASRYVDRDLSPDTAYTYRVTSYNESGESTFTSSLNVNTPREIPSSPARLRTEATSSTSIRLQWDDESDNENGFRVYRNGNRIATVEEDTTVYVHKNLKGERRYCYEVVAFNESGESETTNRNCAMTPPSIPLAPDRLRASPQSPRRIRLTWDDSSNNEEGFRVYRNGVTIATLEPNRTSYLDTELAPESSYSYEVSAFNRSGESRLAGSGQVSTPAAALEEPPAEPEEPETEEPSLGRTSLLAGIGIVIMVMGYIYSEMG